MAVQILPVWFSEATGDHVWFCIVINDHVGFFYSHAQIMAINDHVGFSNPMHNHVEFP